VMMGVEEHKRGERDFEILQILIQGEKEVAAGVGFELGDVLAEADAILDGEPPCQTPMNHDTGENGKP
jgi:hypothetical protein